ncbi:uncharacterized protein LOC124285142 isoform X2 [Haliotis rubra]|uniref:uncharacterized protein LOC124285142 isoform X2 n=1 Tax=Haliotis rubra TaxID=36100 RepID=UPI001EE55013|nr:uncharacterized protein LOC124285142 isoform X2 [Haliotis rubra]
MASCPKISNSSVPQSIVTIDNINDVRLSTTERAVGTKVTISCHDGRRLVGASELTCQASGQWNNAIPKCELTSTTSTDSSVLTQQELIVIGVVAAICILLIIMVVVMMCACLYKRRRDKTHKRPASEFSLNTGEGEHYRPYSMYTPFPSGSRGIREGSIDRGHRSSHRHYNSSLPRSNIPESFPRTNYPNAYELQTRTADFRPKPYTSYAGPRIARASSDTYEDYMAERNQSGFRPPVRSGIDNEGFRGEWTDRYDRKTFSDFNRDAYSQGRDPFLWDKSHLRQGSRFYCRFTKHSL